MPTNDTCSELIERLIETILTKYDLGYSHKQIVTAVRKLLTPQTKEHLQPVDYIMSYRLCPDKKYMVVFWKQSGSETFVSIVPDRKEYTLKSVQAEWRKLGRQVLDVRFVETEEGEKE